MTKLASPAPYASSDPGLQFGVTSPWPYSKNRPHKGKDYQWSKSNIARSRETYSPVDGVVVAAYDDGEYNQGWGNYVLIKVNEHVYVRLAHHKTGSVRVKVGQRVWIGQRIGTMGDTGEAPGGIHLHEELLIDGVRVNPDLYRGPNGRDLPGTPSTSGGGDKPVPPKPNPDPVAPEEEDDDMSEYTVHAKADATNGTDLGDWSLGHPTFGKGLKKGTYRTLYKDGKGGVINEYVGFLATNIQPVFKAWTRTHAHGEGKPTSRTVEEDYHEIQRQLTLVAEIAQRQI